MAFSDKKMAMSRCAFEALSTTVVCNFLLKEIPTISEKVLQKIEEHKVDGEVFIQIAADDEHLKEIAPLLGDRWKLKKVLKTLLDDSVVSFVHS